MFQSLRMVCFASATIGATSGLLAPIDSGMLLADGTVCACKASHTSPAPSQATGCGNGPLIVPTSPSSTDGACDKDKHTCTTKTNSNCTGSVNVQVTFPSSGNTCSTVWVQGGTTYPNPTQINSTSQNVTLRVSVTCKAASSGGGGGGDVASAVGQATFLLWKANPGVATPLPTADGSYTFSVTCGACAETSSGV
jgi:hypothetical protein